ncbi:hypothetical protein FIBSPDRAFT_764385 [Athelia psychrophila]|uniref:Uncharacterized protein n=1 Tax=Athelia psychrophila TaxID=1759441 RepID=A0A167WTU7_9AGAM|nr:hypothetical protein FIBSPDRAFT_764385 [Fibularhizoctonia sp. CBS 109695]
MVQLADNQIAAQDGTLSKSDQTSRLYILAAIYCDISEKKRAARDQDFVGMREMMADLKIRLEATFTLTKEQRTNLRKTANDIVYQANRTCFSGMNVDVMKFLEENSTNLGFANVFGNAAREQELVLQVRRVSSSVRNSFRQEIFDSIQTNKKCSLQSFTYRSAVKFRRGQFEQSMGFGYTIHNVILVRVMLYNPLIHTKCSFIALASIWY